MRTDRAVCLVSFLIVLTGGCTLGPPNAGQEAGTSWDAPEGTTWVVKDYGGGRQCGQEVYELPDTAEVLAAGGVEVIEVVVQHKGRCRSCDCAAYSARHFALIPESDVRAAQWLGFNEGAPDPERL